MPKTKRPHIPQTYFKRLRKWFSRQVRRLCCFSKVEDFDGSFDVVSDPQEEKPMLDLQRVFLPTSIKSAPLPGDECGCGGAGEHPVEKVTSAHAGSTQSEVTPQPSISSPLLPETRENVNILPDCRRSVLGDYHQNNIPSAWEPSRFSGTQCTTTSFTAIVASKVLPLGLWSSKTINKVVRLGDRLHASLIDQLDMAGVTWYLASDEMPEYPEDNYIWPVRCTKSEEFQGLISSSPLAPESLIIQLTGKWYPGKPFREFGDALERCLSGEVQGCIVTLNYRSSAVFKNPVGGYSVFDSHSRNIQGLIDNKGKASLLTFASLRQVEEYFRDMANGETRYSLTGFKVDLMD